jgi:hypothetical protein
MRTLKMGARIIELDVHEKRPEYPVISHAARYAGKTRFGSMSERFELTIAVVKQFLDENPGSSPIVIDFEFGSLSSDTQMLMADQLETILRGHLVAGRMDFRTCYPEDYIGKVILSCGGGAASGLKLKNMMNVLQRDDYWFRNRGFPTTQGEVEEIQDWIRSTNGFHRVYPRNVLLSSNIDGVEGMETLGAQAVAMNYGLSDRYLKRYIEFFDNQPLVGYRPKNASL